jgi:hypothetical protein
VSMSVIGAGQREAESRTGLACKTNDLDGVRYRGIIWKRTKMDVDFSENPVSHCVAFIRTSNVIKDSFCYRVRISNSTNVKDMHVS